MIPPKLKAAGTLWSIIFLPVLVCVVYTLYELREWLQLDNFLNELLLNFFIYFINHYFSIFLFMFLLFWSFLLKAVTSQFVFSFSAAWDILLFNWTFKLYASLGFSSFDGVTSSLVSVSAPWSFVGRKWCICLSKSW